MPRILVVLVLVTLARPTFADEWLAHDKGLHFAYSATFAATATAALPLVLQRDADFWTCALGATLGFAPGIAKEVRDLGGRGDPSGKDLAWDAIGSLTGASATCLLQRLWRPARF